MEVEGEEEGREWEENIMSCRGEGRSIVSKVSGMMGDAVQGVGCSLLSGLPCVREPPQSTVPPGPPKGGDRSQQEVPARPHKRG